ncbi:MAG TPA: hypothetical protein ENI15_10730 [Spirochaetes bacterium]|nr:hypothetical protein [Spirochaetota bacterium]
MRLVTRLWLSTAVAVFAFIMSWPGEEDSVPDLQTSPYQWDGVLGEEYLELMCSKHGIDYHADRATLGYRIECPKCEPGWCPAWDSNSKAEGTGGAFYEYRSDGQTIFRFLAAWPKIEKLEAGESVLMEAGDSRSYCGECGYPVGTDWRVIDLEKPEPSEEFIITAYCPCVKCCGSRSPGVTASGLDLTDFYGKIVAAAPEYPFGTIMDIPGYGIATVQDRGGKIKGMRLDVFFHDHADAVEFGGQRLKVKVRLRK